MMIKDLGLDFITRTIRTNAALLLIFVPFGLFYIGLYPTLAVFSGGVWGILNLLFISRLVQTTLRPEGAEAGKAIGLALIKFPLLYASGYFLLKVPQFEAHLLLVGFSSLLAVMLLKVLGRALLGLDNGNNKSEKLQKAL